MCEEIVYMFDSYMKKSILNCIKRYAKREVATKIREVSIDSIIEELETKETALLSDKDNYAVFDFNEENRKDKKLEEYFSDDKMVQAVTNLSQQEKDMLLSCAMSDFQVV